jgi:hypothetical protein
MIALEFFARERIPFWEMRNVDELVGNPERDNRRYCFAKPGELYLVYLPEGGAGELDLSGATGTFDVHWFNPREGGALQTGTLRSLEGGAKISLGEPPHDVTADWLAVVRRSHANR